MTAFEKAIKLFNRWTSQCLFLTSEERVPWLVHKIAEAIDKAEQDGYERGRHNEVEAVGEDVKMDLAEALAVWLGPCNDATLQEAAERIAAVYGYETTTPVVLVQTARRLLKLADLVFEEALKMTEALLEEIPDAKM